VYDPAGRRAQKTINGVSTQFLYDGSNPVQEIQNGAPIANLLTGLGIDEYFSRTDAAGPRTFLADNLRSALAVTDSTGAIQTQYVYDPFGNATVTGAASTNPYQYTGRENDVSGLDYYRARYYSPTFQRFIAEDPRGFAGSGPNLHAYVGNNPTNRTDPSGLEDPECEDIRQKISQYEAEQNDLNGQKCSNLTRAAELQRLLDGERAAYAALGCGEGPGGGGGLPIPEPGQDEEEWPQAAQPPTPGEVVPVLTIGTILYWLSLAAAGAL
jgi:RHS repeat-associated protein